MAIEPTAARTLVLSKAPKAQNLLIDLCARDEIEPPGFQRQTHSIG